MKKNNCVLTTILSLGLAFAPLTNAFAENNLVQLDLKKGSGNAVDVTFFTSENYGGSVIVRKKSDNKYVILMPKVLTSGYRSTDLGSVHDLITNLDVKSVNDGAAGYTKITVITTKPLNITTHVAKAEPLTDGQKQYRTLLAEAYTVKNNINKTAPQKAAPQKTEVTVNKAPQQNSQSQKNNASVQNTNNQSAPKQDVKPQIKLTPIDTKNLTTTQEKKISLPQEEKINKKNSTEIMPAVPSVTPTPIQPTVNATEQPLQDIKEVKKLDNKNLSRSSIKSHLKTLKREVQQKMPAGIATTLILTLIPLLALLAFVKLIKSSIKSSRTLKKSFLERISKAPRQKNYDHIINNENLNWQEKYQMFINQSGNDDIKSEPDKQKSVERVTDVIEEQRQKLEQLVTPQDEPKIDTAPIKSEGVKVYEAETAIGETLKNAAKIKAFDPTLTEAKRNIVRKKSRFTRFATKEDYEQTETPNVSSPIQHQANIQLKPTPLTGSARELANANLKVADIRKDDYIMSSLEEFFATSDVQETASKQSAQTVSVASTLAQIKPSMKITKPVHKETQNPIELTKTDNSESPTFSGLIVKTGHNIDEERGFYIVNLDGTSALIGRIKEEVFVLKKFDDNETKRLQVRQDKDSVYMVKTDGFKSLVDVNNMGVLIEL